MPGVCPGRGRGRHYAIRCGPRADALEVGARILEVPTMCPRVRGAEPLGDKELWIPPAPVWPEKGKNNTLTRRQTRVRLGESTTRV